MKAKSKLKLTKKGQAKLEPIPIRANNTDDPFYVASTEPVDEDGKILAKLPRSDEFHIEDIIERGKARSIQPRANLYLH